MKIIDLHCDTISYLREKGEGLYKNGGHFDIERARKAEIGLQFFAIFTMPADRNTVLRQVLLQVEKFYSEIEANGETLYIVKKYNDIKANSKNSKIGCLLHLEGGECIADDIEMLSLLYRLGIRSIGLTWNKRNLLGDGVGEGENAGGLSLMGHKVVKEMERLGLILDLAHLSKQSFYDAVEIYDKPILVSHANARQLCEHPRNLDDRQLKVLAEKEGIIGVTQYADFIKKGEPSLDDMLDHIVYIADLIGVEHVALGSDYDGADRMVIPDIEGYGQLSQMLAKRDFTNKEIEMILYYNALNFLEKVI